MPAVRSTNMDLAATRVIKSMRMTWWFATYATKAIGTDGGRCGNLVLSNTFRQKAYPFRSGTPKAGYLAAFKYVLRTRHRIEIIPKYKRRHNHFRSLFRSLRTVVHSTVRRPWRRAASGRARFDRIAQGGGPTADPPSVNEMVC